MVTSKYANTSAGQVQIDLDENHGRTMSRSHIQDICDVVGSIASVKEATWNYTIPVEADEVATIAMGVDGTCMLTCDDGKRQAMVGTVSLYGSGGRPSAYAVCGRSPGVWQSDVFGRYGARDYEDH